MANKVVDEQDRKMAVSVSLPRWMVDWMGKNRSVMVARLVKKEWEKNHGK